jgi:hypothetical protein
MRLAWGPAAEAAKRVRLFFRDPEQDQDRGALARRLRRVTAFGRREAPLDRLSIPAEEGRAMPLYEQSVYGTLPLGEELPS